MNGRCSCIIQLPTFLQSYSLLENRDYQIIFIVRASDTVRSLSFCLKEKRWKEGMWFFLFMCLHVQHILVVCSLNVSLTGALLDHRPEGSLFKVAFEQNTPNISGFNSR